MADVTNEQLLTALQKAKDAGNTEAAKSIAKMLQANGYTAGGGQTTGGQQPAADQPWQPDTSPEHSKAVLDAYEAMPWYMKAQTAAGDLYRNAAQGYTGGVNNKALQGVAKLAGGYLGDPTQVYRTREQADADSAIRSPGSAAAANVAGMYFSPIGIALKAEQMAQGAFPIVRNATGQVMAQPFNQTLGRFVSRLGLGGAENVGVNAVSNIGHDRPPEEGAVPAAAFGGGVTSVLGPLATKIAGGIGEGVQWLRGNREETPQPSTQDLGRTADTRYQNLKDAGHLWDTGDFSEHLARLRDDPRMEDVYATDANGDYTGPYPGTRAADQHIDNRIARQNSPTIDFNTIDQMTRNTRAQAEAPAAAGGDIGRDQPHRVLTGGMDDFLYTPTTTGFDISPDLRQAKNAESYAKNSELMDAYQQAGPRGPQVLRDALRNNPQFYDPVDTAAINDLINAHEQGPGWAARGARAIARPVATALGYAGAQKIGLGPVWQHITGGATGIAGQGATDALTGGPFANRLSNQANVTRRILTGEPPPPGTPFADAVNSVTARDRLARVLMGGYQTPPAQAEQADLWGAYGGT